MEKTPSIGKSIICIDNKYLKNIKSRIRTRNIITYSLKDKKSDVFIKILRNDNKYTSFKIFLNKKIKTFKGEYNFKIKLLGDHNILNCAASIIASLLTGVKISLVKKSLLNYQGVKRRFTFIGYKHKDQIIDDYAHHPTEIEATFKTAKKISNNIVVVFQPHRYSRTNFLMNDFVKILSKISKLYLLKTYPAGEKLIKKATSKNLYLKILKKNKKIVYVENEKKLSIYLNKHINKKTLIIFMGAGSISKIAYNYYKK